MKVGDVKRRKEENPCSPKTGDSFYRGKVIVLVDSKSGSAAELFARTMQIEKRGLVLGDRSAGAVTIQTSRPYARRSSVVVFGASITDADIIMTDGKSLEHVGVVPDEILLPTAAAIWRVLAIRCWRACA